MTQLRSARPWGRLPLCLRQVAARRPRHGVPSDAWPRDNCERGILGTLAVSLRPAGVQVAVSSAHPRRLADAQLLRLSGYERHRHIMAAIRTEGLQLGFPGDVRRTRHHAVAHLHGSEGAVAPGVRLILGISSDTEPKEVALLISLIGLWKSSP